MIEPSPEMEAFGCDVVERTCGECGANLNKPDEIRAGFHKECAQEMNEVMEHNASHPHDQI